MSIAVVASRFNELVVERLVAGALDELNRSGVGADRITLAWAPGAFELPLVARHFAASGAVAGIVCLGAVIRGGTDHYTHVAGQCAAGLARVQLDFGIPVAFGVLTTDTVDQALDRSGGKGGNKGAEAARGTLETIDLLDKIGKPQN